MKSRLQATKAPAWIPTQQGDVLIGEVVNRSTRSNDNGDYEVIVVQPTEVTVGGKSSFLVGREGEETTYESGTPLAWHAIGRVGARAVHDANPQYGDEVGVLFDGTAIAQAGPGKGKSYRIFKVVCDHNSVPQPVESPVQSETLAFVVEADDDEDF